MRGKYKTQRGRARRFTSSHDPNAYIRSQPARGEDEEEEEEGGSSLNKGKDTTGADGSDSASVSSSSGEGESAEEEEEGEEEETPEKEVAKLSLADAKRSTVGSKKAPGSATGSTGAPRELSRREREAIERERARQHFLKMKEKEDAARLAVIRKRREEEAALHAAELKGVGASSPLSPSPASLGAVRAPDTVSSSQVGLTQQQLQQLLPTTISQLLYRLGKELTCAICLGILSDPTSTPCNHAFCKSCLDRMLRVGRKSEAPCPMCKMRISRRNVVSNLGLQAVTRAFEELAKAYERQTSRAWDSTDEQPALTRKALAEVVNTVPSSTPDTQRIRELEWNHVQLVCEIGEIDRLLARGASPEKPSNAATMLPDTETLALLEAINFPSSPNDDLFPLNINCNLASDPRSQPIILLTSLVNETTSITDVGRFVERFALQRLSSWSDTVTHLVTPAKDHVAKRTLKYFLSILHGCWIVSTDWMEAANRTGKLPREFGYEVTGDEAFPVEEGPRRARLSRAAGEAPLLAGYSFYLYGTFGAPSIDELALLIRKAGAQLITSIGQLREMKGPTCRTLILCDPNKQADFEKDVSVIAKHRPLLATTWLLDCISTYQIVDITPYIVLE